MLILSAAWLAAYALHLRSSPATMFVGWLPCIAAPAALGIVTDYGIRLIRCAVRRSVRPREWRWYAVPLLAVIVIVAWRTQWPLRLRFELSRPAMERAAAKWLVSTPATLPYAETWCLDYQWDQDRHCRIGSYAVETVVVFPRERIVFFVTGGFFRATWGFLYDPDNRALEAAPEVGHDWETRPLAPNWRTYVEARP